MIAGLWPIRPHVAYNPDDDVAPQLSSDDYLAALQYRLPRGRAWSRDADATLTALLKGIADGWADVNAREVNLLIDAFPTTTSDLITEWQETLGLPDPCAGPTPLQSEQLAQIEARVTNTGGQSVDYFIQYAATLGYPITITEFSPWVCGDVVGIPLYGNAWAWAWQVNAPTFRVRYFLCGVDVAGDPLADWDATTLQCELKRFAPGQTVLIFNYS